MCAFLFSNDLAKAAFSRQTDYFWTWYIVKISDTHGFVLLLPRQTGYQTQLSKKQYIPQTSEGIALHPCNKVLVNKLFIFSFTLSKIHDLQKQLATSRLQVLEESNYVKDWKEKFAAIERKAEELEVNLTETNNQIKHKEANRNSQLTQTDGLSHVSNTFSS